MQALPADPTIYYPRGAPVFWAGAWRGPTFGRDAGDVRDAARRSGSGARTAGVTWADGPLGKCLAFNGTSGAVSVPAAAALGAFTVAAWANPANTNTGFTFLACKGTASNRNYSLDVRASGLNFGFTAGGAFKEVVSGTTVTGGQWWHLAGTFDGATLRVYTNGVLNASAAAAFTPDATAGLSLGSIAGASSWWVGSVADVRVHDYALTPGQVAREYADPGWRLRRPAAGYGFVASGRFRRAGFEGGFSHMNGGFSS